MNDIDLILDKLKQLFCKHIWKEVKREPLRREVVEDTYGTKTYDYFVIRLDCIKCDKRKAIERRFLIE